MYQVIARKYRPQTFSELIGQEHVRTTIENAIAQGRIAHGYIFSGQRGTGKTTVARILAMALNCNTVVGTPERPTHEPCLQCVSCREISSGGSAESAGGMNSARRIASGDTGARRDALVRPS